MKQREYDAYAIVNGKSEDFDSAQKSLASRVDLQMVKGWKPQGGVIFTALLTESDGVTRFVFSQAMFKPAALDSEDAERQRRSLEDIAIADSRRMQDMQDMADAAERAYAQMLEQALADDEEARRRGEI